MSHLKACSIRRIWRREHLSNEPPIRNTGRMVVYFSFDAIIELAFYKV